MSQTKITSDRLGRKYLQHMLQLKDLIHNMSMSLQMEIETEIKETKIEKQRRKYLQINGRFIKE